MTPGEVTRLAILGRLNRGSDHGYSIHQHLSRTGLFDGPSGRTYRVLRELSEAGLVWSTWRFPNDGTGPAQRVYELTDEGERYVSDSTLTFNAHVRALRLVRDDLAGR